MNKVSIQDRAEAAHVKVFRLGENQPTNFQYIGRVESNSCKFMIWDKPASAGDAIEQVKYKALKMGANAVIDISSTPSGTDAWGTNCWNSVEVSGTAVKLPP